jgi:fructokinase
VLTVIGETLIDLIGGSDGETYAARPGGSPLNVAVGLARLGNPTALMARLATGVFGSQLRTYATGNGLDLRWAVTAAEPATLAVVAIDDAGQAAYDFYVDGTADWQWTDAELRRMPDDTEVVHTGSLAAWRTPAIADVLESVRAGGSALITFDPNIRPLLMGSRPEAVALVERYVGLAHVVKVSDEDLTWLYPGQPAEEIAAAWLRLGPDLVVTTFGKDGCAAWSRSGTVVRRPAVTVEVVDTVGAGDAFMAALIDGLVRGGFAHPGADVPADALAGVVERATLAAGLTCGRPGADPPTRAELDRSN